MSVALWQRLGFKLTSLERFSLSIPMAIAANNAGIAQRTSVIETILRQLPVECLSVTLYIDCGDLSLASAQAVLARLSWGLIFRHVLRNKHIGSLVLYQTGECFQDIVGWDDARCDAVLRAIQENDPEALERTQMLTAVSIPLNDAF